MRFLVPSGIELASGDSFKTSETVVGDSPRCPASCFKLMGARSSRRSPGVERRGLLLGMARVCHIVWAKASRQPAALFGAGSHSGRSCEESLDRFSRHMLYIGRSVVNRFSRPPWT